MLTEVQIKKLDEDGYLHCPNFISINKCQELKKEIENIIDEKKFIENINKIPVFSTNDYLLNSSYQISPFLEQNAHEILEKDPKSKFVFNKIGHALHALNPVFKKVTFDSNVKDIFKSIGYQKPIVCQSMYIFKQPFIGSEVKRHQDASYLIVNPPKMIGVWIALEDCTIENGCLEFLPGSNKDIPVTTQLIRNPNEEEFKSGNCLIYTHGKPTDIKFDDSLFVSVPVKAGDAILIDGLVVHRSGSNSTSKSRQIYSFHVYESDKATYSKQNWMQYNQETFLPLYETNSLE